MKKIILFTGLLLISVHFFMVSAYLVKPGAYSFFYVYPYFHQDWNLFVPPPDASYELILYDKQKGQINRIYSNILDEHQRNRLKGLSPLVIALSNSIHYFENSAGARGLYSGKVSEDDLNFKILKKIALRLNEKAGYSSGEELITIIVVNENRRRRIYFS